MNAFATLSYGDCCTLKNTLRTLHRHPGRLVMWALYALAIVGFAFMKTSAPRRGGVPSAFAVTLSDFWICGIVFAFGIVLASGTARWLGIFSSRAEALLLTRAQVRPIALAAYLQLRAVISALGQGIVRFAYLVLFGLPAGTSWHALAAQLCFFAAAGAAVASVALPRSLARGPGRTAMIVAGVAIATLAALPVLVDLTRLVGFGGLDLMRDRVPNLHPGIVLSALANGDLRGIAIPLAVAACASAAFAIAARDPYPELYAISLANLDWRATIRSRRGARASDAAAPSMKHARSTAGSRLRGALAFVWADSLMFSRRVSPVITALVAALALAIGAGLAAFTQRGNGEIAFGVIVGMLPGTYIAIASTTGVRLAPVLRMSLFWLGSEPLAARLAAWTFSGFLRDAVLAALAVAGYIAVSREVATPAAVFAGALGLLVLTRTVGLAIFALLPSSLDQRGPAVLLRTLLTFALIAPPVVVAAAAAFLLAAPFAFSIISGTLIALSEAAILVTFSAWRLAGRVDRLSLA